MPPENGKFKAAKQLAQAPPTDLELTHYRQRVPRRKKGETFWGIRTSVCFIRSVIYWWWIKSHLGTLILQEESHKIDLLSIQIDKYETISDVIFK